MGLPLAADDGLFAVCSVSLCVLCVCVCMCSMCVCVCLSKVFIKRKSAQLGACYYAKGFRAQSVYGVGCTGRGGRVGGRASCGTSSALKCSDRALHKFVWLCLCCVATSMLHNPIKFSLRLCYYKKQQQQRKRCLICSAVFIDFFSKHTHTHLHTHLHTGTLCWQFTLFFYAPLASRTY